MCNTIKKRGLERGFTLVEIAIVLVLVGFAMTAAVQLYNQYRIDKDRALTEGNIQTSLGKIGTFRSVYGRYPCPASSSASLGDFNYGFEQANCAAITPNTCVDGVCAFPNPNNGVLVIIGALPFKDLGILEPGAYDAQLSRLRYAVTADLTSSTTFDVSAGGIGIINKLSGNNSVIDPPDRGHFVVVSHGPNRYGTSTKVGALTGACQNAPVLERENCDEDPIFVSRNVGNNFDDRVFFFSGVQLSEWQLSEADPDHMHAKNLRSVSVGATGATDMSGVDVVSVYSFGADTGTVRVTPNNDIGGVPVASEGFIFAEDLCPYGSTDCWNPRLFAGTMATGANGLYTDEADPGRGMSCYQPAQGKNEFLIGVEDGAPICSDEIYVSCPNGSFITGIDANGVVTCNAPPEDRCPDTPITTVCGDTRTLQETYSGGNFSVYTGECRTFAINYDAAYWQNFMATGGSGGGVPTMAEIEAEVDGINILPRTNVVCGTTAENAQIRETHTCDAGTWLPEFVAHERRDYGSTFPSNPLTTAGAWIAETGSSSPDLNNTEEDHDCWAREDYRVVTGACYGGLAGIRVMFQKHRSPQTSHQWTTVHTSTELCACQPGTIQTTQSCNSYYQSENGSFSAPDMNNPPQTNITGLTGDVISTFDILCVGGVPEQQYPATNIDVDDCSCRPVYHNDIIQDCPNGQTNAFTGPHGSYTGVLSINEQDFKCPGTQTGGLPDPSYWTIPTPWGPPPACTCDSNLSDVQIVNCPAGQQGAGNAYTRHWDCTLNPAGNPPGAWEPQNDPGNGGDYWEQPSHYLPGLSDCRTCAWESTGAPNNNEFAFGPQKGSLCSCGEDPALLCYDYGGSPEPYNIWGPCPCVVQ